MVDFWPCSDHHEIGKVDGLRRSGLTTVYKFPLPHKDFDSLIVFPNIPNVIGICFKLFSNEFRSHCNFAMLVQKLAVTTFLEEEQVFLISYLSCEKL